MGRLRYDRHEMVEGETNKLELDLAPAAGANSITSVTWAGDGLTFADQAESGTDATVFVSGGTADTEVVCTATVVIASGETKVYGFVIEWKKPNKQWRRGR